MHAKLVHGVTTHFAQNSSAMADNTQLLDARKMDNRGWVTLQCREQSPVSGTLVVAGRVETRL